jgi:diaminopimelate epimerase
MSARFTKMPRFTKMHGAGNDFVVIDERAVSLGLSAAQVVALADRRLGIGCDQLITLEAPPPGSPADLFMRIRNPDGSEAGACGNATRCVVDLVHRQTGQRAVLVQTISGLLPAEMREDGLVCVDMGPPRLEWQDIPLARPMDTLHLALAAGPLTDPAAASMGNPHATFFVPDLAAVPLAKLGPLLEHDALFPQRANIGVVQVLARDRLRLRVWERGAGLTLACGSGACAALVNAVRRGLADRTAALELDGGRLEITWRDDGHVLMTGPVVTSFTGEISL